MAPWPEVHSYYTSGALRKVYSGFSPTGDWTRANTQMVNDAGQLAEAEVSYGPTTVVTSPRY